MSCHSTTWWSKKIYIIKLIISDFYFDTLEEQSLLCVSELCCDWSIHLPGGFFYYYYFILSSVSLCLVSLYFITLEIIFSLLLLLFWHYQWGFFPFFLSAFKGECFNWPQVRDRNYNLEWHHPAANGLTPILLCFPGDWLPAVVSAGLTLVSLSF